MRTLIKGEMVVNAEATTVADLLIDGERASMASGSPTRRTTAGWQVRQQDDRSRGRARPALRVLRAATPTHPDPIGR